MLVRKTVPLSSILLYLDNPRLPETDSESEAILEMVKDQQRKLIALARDIVEYGISELDLLAVFPDKQEGFYRVAEGNRRITVLKLLQDSSVIKNEEPSIAREFSEISKKSNLNYDRIPVVIFSSSSDPKLLHFMQIRHLGENEGVGTVKWSAAQKARFDYRTQGKENLVIFLDSLEKDGYLTREQIDHVTLTNWQRIFRPVGLSFLKLTKEGTNYKIVSGCEEEFSQKIKMAAEQLKDCSVGVVYGKDQIDLFFNELEKHYRELKIPSPVSAVSNPISENDSSTQPSFPNAKNSASILMANGDSPSAESSEATALPALSSSASLGSTYKLPKDPYNNCKTVIPSAERIQSRNHRINQIISELKTLEVENYPNACGCLLRALIELSAKEYLEHSNSDPKYDATAVQFSEAIAIAVQKLVQQGFLVSSDSAAIKKETRSGDTRLLFNGYMHNTEVYPSPVVIKGIFQTYSKFLKACLR
jgi:hypothetical protein